MNSPEKSMENYDHYISQLFAIDSGTKRYNTAVAAHPALVSTVVPVLRRQGLDGLTISVKRAG